MLHSYGRLGSGAMNAVNFLGSKAKTACIKIAIFAFLWYNGFKIKDFDPFWAKIYGITTANSPAVYFLSVCSAFPHSEKMRVDYICILPVQEIHKKLGDILDGKNGWNGVQRDSGADHPAG